jgi:anti-anti-sigma factor
MTLALQVYRSVGMSTVRCAGNIYFGGSAESLERSVKELTTPIVVIDLERVTLVDARGLGVLAGLYQWAEEQHVRFYLANPRGQLQELLRITGLGFLFEDELALLAG